MSGNVLIKFIRKNNGILVGAIVASDNNQIGWSLCNKADRHNGKFDKIKAVEIAYGRSLRVKDPQKVVDNNKIAISARKEYIKMIKRAKNFKGF